MNNNINLEEQISFIYNNEQKEGIIYSINPIEKTYDIFCKEDNVLYKDIPIKNIK